MGTRRFGHLDALAITTGLWFLAKLLRYAFPPLFEPFQSIYGVSNAEIGLAFTGFMLCYAAMQFPSGILRDRFGPVRVMATGGIVAAVAAISLAAEAGFVALVLVMLVIGTGTGLHKTVSIVLLARVYPERKGRVLGIHDTFGSGAGVVAPIGAVFFLDRFGWRLFFVLAGLAGLVLGAIALVRIPARMAQRSVEHVRTRDPPAMLQYVDLFRDPHFSLFVLVTVLFSFSYNGVVAFLPLYLIDVASIDVGQAGLLYSLLFAVTVVQLLTGELSDRIGQLWVLLACLAVGFVGGVLFLLVTAPIALAIAVMAFGIGTHGYRPARDAYLTAVVPASAAGGGIGLVRTLLMGAGAVAPALVGVTADFVGFRPAFAILAGALGIATLLVLPLLVVGR